MHQQFFDHGFAINFRKCIFLHGLWSKVIDSEWLGHLHSHMGHVGPCKAMAWVYHALRRQDEKAISTPLYVRAPANITAKQELEICGG